MYLGIEIGGTKLQVGIGPGDGTLLDLWRGQVDATAGATGIRAQIAAAVPELLSRCGVDRSSLQGIGIGFGGPVDDAKGLVIQSHQISGWDGFPLQAWAGDLLGIPAFLGNDADVAGLAEAMYGAGRGFSPIFYVTIGSGIGGGLIVDGTIFRGSGRGAAEIGQLKLHAHPQECLAPPGSLLPLEQLASGWAIGARARLLAATQVQAAGDLIQRSGGVENITGRTVAEAALEGDRFSQDCLVLPRYYLAEALCHVIALICPRRIIIGGGVSLMGEAFLFEPLRQLVADQVFSDFSHCGDIVSAQLGEGVVVHGALALARGRSSHAAPLPNP